MEGKKALFKRTAPRPPRTREQRLQYLEKMELTHFNMIGELAEKIKRLEEWADKHKAGIK